MTIRHRAIAYCLLATIVGAAPLYGQRSKKDTASTFEIYGFAMADAIYEFNQSDPNWFDANRPTKLPSFEHQFGGNGRSWVSARQSRLGVKASFPAHDVKAVFEFDMFGVGPDAGQTTIRLRHAYGQWGQVGAGQTNSAFMDVDVFPNVLDYWGPNGMLFFRNAMVFWKPIDQPGGSNLMLAIERPGASGDAGVYADRVELGGIIPRFAWPDLSGHYRYGERWGYVQLGGIVRDIRWDDALVDTFDLAGGVTGWGVSLSSGLNVTKRDLLHLQAIYGHGVQNYFNDAPVDVGIENDFGNRRTPIVGVALPVVGLVAYLDHTWDKRWSTAIGYSRVQIDNSDAQAADAFHVGQYASVNLLATPVPHVMMGGELQWAQRSNFDDDFTANNYRLQFSFKYSFSQTFGGGGQ
jgi:hypothetical protein